ncbi:MAG: hypothetical protein COV52_03185, partial [Gammaproteobacteria bacterium CG11_big_fil_rev_8_21_14_0_20_46_22]
MNSIQQAEILLSDFVINTEKVFGSRIVAIYKFGSLGSHGDFSACSDVDAVVMLTSIEKGDKEKFAKISEEITSIGEPYSDRLSIFWSSVKNDDFSKGIGRFPALDRLDFIQHAILMAGDDCRHGLTAPLHEEIVKESAEFILGFMLTPEKYHELTAAPEVILAKGARYLTKFVLFPVRLTFTLDKPGVIGSNADSLKHFVGQYSAEMASNIMSLIKQAYTLRSRNPSETVMIDKRQFHCALLQLYIFCL